MKAKHPHRCLTLLASKSADDIVRGSTGKEARYLAKLRHLLSKTEESDRKLLLNVAEKMSNR